MANEMKVEWACPKCGAEPDKHGKGGDEKCKRLSGSMPGQCNGFLCDCDDLGEDPEHGEDLHHICPNATCDHCGWVGSFPRLPQGLQAWEKKALAAGWMPPEMRAAELAKAASKGKPGL